MRTFFVYIWFLFSIVGCKFNSTESSRLNEEQSVVAGATPRGIIGPSAYRFKDAAGKTPFVLLFKERDSWATSLIKNATRTAHHPSGALDVNFVGLAFERVTGRQAWVTFIGETTAYRYAKPLDLQQLYEGKDIELSFAQQRSLLGNVVSAKSYLKFSYDRNTDSILLKTGRGSVKVGTYFKSAEDSAVIANVNSVRDDSLILDISKLKIEQ